MCLKVKIYFENLIYEKLSIHNMANARQYPWKLYVSLVEISPSFKFSGVGLYLGLVCVCLFTDIQGGP